LSFLSRVKLVQRIHQPDDPRAAQVIRRDIRGKTLGQPVGDKFNVTEVL
jgi:hypothetical protein